jgi:hypothetical protein
VGKTGCDLFAAIYPGHCVLFRIAAIPRMEKEGTTLTSVYLHRLPIFFSGQSQNNPQRKAPRIHGEFPPGVFQ